MATAKPGPRYSKEEFSRRGHELFDAIVKPRLKPRDKGKYVAIDIETGEYEMHRDAMTAGNRLWERLGDPQAFMLRVGYPAPVKTGFRKVSAS